MEQVILTVFLALFAIQFTVEFGLNELNLRHVGASLARHAIPEVFRGKIDLERYRRSIEYSLVNGRFHRWSELYGSAILLIVLFSGLLGFIDQWSGQLARGLSLNSYGHGIIFLLWYRPDLYAGGAAD